MNQSETIRLFVAGLETALAAWFAWNLVQGLRGPTMHFGVEGTFRLSATRRDSPTGFWLAAALNISLALIFAAAALVSLLGKSS